MTGAGGILIVLFVFIFWLSAKLLLISPLVIPLAVIYVLRRRGISRTISAVTGFAPVLLFAVWATYGLSELRDICRNAPSVFPPSQRTGTIDALLISDGPGRWWQDDRIDIERLVVRSADGIDHYSRKTAKKVIKEKRHGWLLENELHSRYKVAIEPPVNGSFWTRYLGYALITVEERSTGKTVAKVVEPTWGGGLVSAYLTAFRDNNPFAQINNHLSCGYAGTDIGIFRGQSEDRRIQYRSADRNLIDRLFSVN